MDVTCPGAPAGLRQVQTGMGPGGPRATQFEGLWPSAGHTPFRCAWPCSAVFISLQSQEKGSYQALQLGQREGSELGCWAQFPCWGYCFPHHTQQFLDTSICLTIELSSDTLYLEIALGSKG